MKFSQDTSLIILRQAILRPTNTVRQINTGISKALTDSRSIMETRIFYGLDNETEDPLQHILACGTHKILNFDHVDSWDS